MKKCEQFKLSTTKKSPFHDENVLNVSFIHCLFVLFLEGSKNIQFRMANGKTYLFGKNKRDSFYISYIIYINHHECKVYRLSTRILNHFFIIIYLFVNNP